MTKPSDLDRDQRALYDVWRSLGLSEESAMNALREDGQLEVSGFDQVAQSLQNIFGLTESQAERAAAGRDMSVSEARRTWDAAGSGAAGFGSRGDRSGVRDPGTRLALEALDSMSDAECDQMLEEQKRRTPAKKAAPAKQPAGKRTTTVSETTYPHGRR